MSELGQVLREAREKQNITLDELQQTTKIQKRYLVGIEEGNYKILPGSFYVRAFIRQYADAVGLSPEELLLQYESEVPGTAIKQEQIMPIKRNRKRQRKDQMYHRYHKVYDIGPKIIFGVLTIGLFLGVWYVAQLSTQDKAQVDKETNQNKVEYQANEKIKDEKKKESEKKEETPGKTDSELTTPEVGTNETTLELVSSNSEKSRSVYEVKNTKEFSLTIDSVGVSYLDIKNSIGKSFFMGMTKENEKLDFDFSREKEIVLNIGRTSDVVIKVNNTEFVFPSNIAHQYVTFKFSPENQ